MRWRPCWSSLAPGSGRRGAGWSGVRQGRAMLDENGKPIKEAGPSIPSKFWSGRRAGRRRGGDCPSTTRRRLEKSPLFRQGKFRDVNWQANRPLLGKHVPADGGRARSNPAAYRQGRCSGFAGGRSRRCRSCPPTKFVSGGAWSRRCDQRIRRQPRAGFEGGHHGFNIRADAVRASWPRTSASISRYYNVIYDAVDRKAACPACWRRRSASRLPVWSKSPGLPHLQGGGDCRLLRAGR